MQLKNCDLNVKEIRLYPLTRTHPEDRWLRAQESETIPLSLFDLYACAEYLSFGAAPPFLADDDHILFSYFGMLLNSLRESLFDADEEFRLFVEAQGQCYDFSKRENGSAQLADERARRHFRNLLLALQTALDGLADLTALFLTGLIPNLRLGQAQFSQIDNWLSKPFAPTGLLVTPQRHFIQRLYDALAPLVRSGHPEQDWLALMRLYRNKVAHLNNAVFRHVGLCDNTGHFYTFLPRQWPYILEKHMKPADPVRPKDPAFFHNLCHDTLVHQDILTFSDGLRRKVLDVVSTGSSVLLEAYKTLKDLASNTAALAELEKNSKKYLFEYFKSTGGDG